MPAPKLKTFETNPNKDFLRAEYDRAIIERWRAATGRPLRYLGLPSGKMFDIVQWQDLIGRFTAIEREEDQQHLMFLTANVANVEERLHSLYGEFDEILLTGWDRYKKQAEWPYDLINLDYFGGLIYQDLSRPKAIRKMLQMQGVHGRSFLLILTQQLRDGDVIGEKLGFLEDLRKSLKNGVLQTTLHPAIDNVIDWYKDPAIPDAARQALYLNYFLRDYGEGEHFDVKCRPAIIYSGTGGSWMIHFVTDFNYCEGIGHRAASEQSLIDLINVGLLEVENGKLVSTLKQPLLKV